MAQSQKYHPSEVRTDVLVERMDKLTETTALAVTFLRHLLDDTVARSGSNQPMPSQCLGCERKTHHNPQHPCPCTCHKARAFLAHYDTHTEAA